MLLRAPDAWVLVLDPESTRGWPRLARRARRHPREPRVSCRPLVWPICCLAGLSWLLLAHRHDGRSRTAFQERNKAVGLARYFFGDPDSSDSGTRHSLEARRPRLATDGLSEVGMHVYERRPTTLAIPAV